MASYNKIKKSQKKIRAGTKNSENIAAAAIEATSTKKELVSFIHATFF